MKGGKSASAVLTIAEKCKSILASNWEGKLTTVKADAKGSKGDVHSSKVKYIVRKGKPYVWVPENDPHNVNTVIDERGSFAVTSPFPWPLARILKSMKRSPTRIALTGDVIPLNEEKVQSALESLENAVISEHEAISGSTYAVSGLISSANFKSTSHIENLKGLLDGSQSYSIYKFDIRSCTFVDGQGNAKEIDLENIQASKTDPLARYAAMLIDGVNQSESRRRALVLFCLAYLNTRPRDAYMLSIDRNGFDILGLVPNPNPHSTNNSEQFLWKEFRLPFSELACDIEKFCHLLVNMEEEAIKVVSCYSGIGV